MPTPTRREQQATENRWAAQFYRPPRRWWPVLPASEYSRQAEASDQTAMRLGTGRRHSARNVGGEDGEGAL